MSAAADKSNFDTERFIVEVYSRNALWDLTSEEYLNRDLKKSNWEELVDIFLNKEEATAVEKNEYGRCLQRKWKSLRDCVTRECQRLAKLRIGSVTSRKNQYAFYNQLSFLRKVIKTKDASSNMTEVAADEIPTGGGEVTTISTGPSEEHRQTWKKPANGLQAGLQEEDGDRLFLLSLLKPIEQIPEHLRFLVRMQIMQVIKNSPKYWYQCQRHSQFQDNTLTPLPTSMPQPTTPLPVASPGTQSSCDSDIDNYFQNYRITE